PDRGLGQRHRGPRRARGHGRRRRPRGGRLRCGWRRRRRLRLLFALAHYERGHARAEDTQDQHCQRDTEIASQVIPPNVLERVTGIEPASSPWKGEALPLSYTREMLARSSAFFAHARPVGEGGFEPPTACPQSRCATTAPLPGSEQSYRSWILRRLEPFRRRVLAPARRPRARRRRGVRRDPGRRLHRAPASTDAARRRWVHLPP